MPPMNPSQNTEVASSIPKVPITENRYWAGCNQSDGVQADIAVFGIPYDGGACFRGGANEGPARIRRLSAEIPPVLETGESFQSLAICDEGDLFCAGDFVAEHARISAAVSKRLTHAFSLSLGGDHSVVIPVHRAVNRCASEEIGLIFIDAHADLSDQFQGSAYSNACPLRHTMALEKFSPERTVLVGTRCLEPAGRDFIAAHNMTMFTAHEIAARGIRAIAKQIITRFSGLSNVYLSIDIDVLDPAFAPGTGIPDAGGLTTREVITLIRALDVLPVVGADLVEVAPPLDVSDITSFAALRIITALFAVVLKRKERQQRYVLL